MLTLLTTVYKGNLPWPVRLVAEHSAVELSARVLTVSVCIDWGFDTDLSRAMQTLYHSATVVVKLILEINESNQQQ